MKRATKLFDLQTMTTHSYLISWPSNPLRQKVRRPSEAGEVTNDCTSTGAQNLHDLSWTDQQREPRVEENSGDPRECPISHQWSVGFCSYFEGNLWFFPIRLLEINFFIYSGDHLSKTYKLSLSKSCDTQRPLFPVTRQPVNIYYLKLLIISSCIDDLLTL